MDGRGSSVNGDAGKEESSRERPFVEVNAAELDRMVAETHAHLLPTGLYQRSGLVSRPSFIKGLDRDGKQTRSPGILIVSADQIHLHAVEHIDYWKWKEVKGDSGKGKKQKTRVRAACPKEVATKLAGLGDRLRFPVLTAVVTAPVLFNDGRVLQTPGYDRKSGLFYNPLGIEFPPIPDAPTRKDALDALVQLKGLLTEYPWRVRADKGETNLRNVSLSVALAYLLTIARGLSRRADL
jgi:hypothetical protein